MAGTRTAPTYTATPARWRVSLKFIDASGDVRTISLDVLAADYSVAKVETFAAAEQAATQASLCSIEVAAVFAGDEDASNAGTDERNSVFDNVALRAKNATTNIAYDGYIVAPDPLVMLGSTDEIDPASTVLLDVLAAYLALKAGYTFRSARYTERLEKNIAIKL